MFLREQDRPRQGSHVNRFLRRLHLNAGKLLFGKIHATFGTRMRYLITGGSRFDPVVARDFHDFGIDLLNAYGLTETSAAAFLNTPGHVVIGSVGPPLPTIESKILDPQPSEETGQPVGEIIIRGPIVMCGDAVRPEVAEAAFTICHTRCRVSLWAPRARKR